MNGENEGRVIVALPREDDPVQEIGPEEKHMTVVWLGKPEENPDLDMDQVRGQVEVVAQRFGPLTGLVESVGQLGDDKANVLFLRGDGLEECHDDLLRQSYIRDGFGAVEQYPQWTPHTTLGYPEDMNDADVPSEQDAPDEVHFDRLAVWDGDRRDEYPLGTGVITGEEMGLDPEFLTALTEAMTRRITLNDAESLAAAVAECEGACGTAQMATRPILMKRARELGCQHVIPLAWTRRANQVVAGGTPSSAVSSPAGRNVSDVSPFASKGMRSGISDTSLRAAYMRGVREYTMTAPASRPPLSRDRVAQARVNSLIRLAQGDPTARPDDRDLLS